MAKEIVDINIDWAEAFGWKCPFCGGEIDHMDEERDEEAGYADDSYTCQDQGGELCESAFFMVRWSLLRKGDNGDALTLARWIQVSVDEQYVVDPEKASAGERHRAYARAEKVAENKLNEALQLLSDAESALDLEGVLSDDFKFKLHWLRGVVKQDGVNFLDEEDADSL